MNYEQGITSNVFLLTGKPRVGKTTMIKKIINQIGPDLCGGFYTEEIRNSKDRFGFRCVSIDGESKEFANVESSSLIRVGRYGIDIESFEKFAIKRLAYAMKSNKIIVIDEIGFMQMLSTSFQGLVHKIISKSNHIILGTISLDRHPEIDKIKKLKGIKIIELNDYNRDLLSEFIVRDILEVLRGWASVE